MRKHEHQEAELEPRLSAGVVLDLGSYGWRIADLTGEGRLVYPDLVRLAELLGGYGLEPVEVAVVCPLVAVSLRGDDDRHAASRIAEEMWDWWSAESESWTASPFGHVPIDVVPGAINGSREVGVDALVAAAALDQAARIQREELDAQLAVICAHDGDYHHLARFSHPTTLVLAGAFSQAERVRIGRSPHVPHINIAESDLITLHPALPGMPHLTPHLERLPDDSSAWVDPNGVLQPGDVVVVDRREDAPERRSTPLNRPTRQAIESTAMATSSAIVVADPYGVCQAAVRAIGLAELPTVQHVLDLVEWAGWDQPVSIFATIPDVLTNQSRSEPNGSHGDPLPADHASGIHTAWLRRDAELDSLDDAIRGDGDPTTQSRRAELHPARVATDGRERDIVPRAIKRLTTALMADVMLALQRNETAAIVVLSEDPDLAWASDVLREADPSRWERATRVGIHAQRYEVVADPGGVVPSSGAFLTLTDVQVATLCGVVDRPYGRRLRRATTQALELAADWEVKGHDPETGALVIRSVVDRADPDTTELTSSGLNATTTIEALLFTEEAGVEIDERISAGLLATTTNERLHLRLIFDPDHPCAHPNLTIAADAATPAQLATVIDADVESGLIAVDVDDDLVPDLTIGTGHASGRYEHGTIVGIIRDEHGGWVLAEPGHDVDDLPEPEPLRVTAVHEDGTMMVEELDVATSGPWATAADIGPADPPAGLSHIDLRVGDVVMGVRRSRDDQEPRWTVLSSSLPHLIALSS